MTSWGISIKVQPGVLKQGAGNAEEIGWSLWQKTDLARDDSTAASDQNPDLDCSAALDSCLQTWEDNMRRLANSISAVGEKLTKTADNYTGSDERGKGLFDGILG